MKAGLEKITVKARGNWITVNQKSETISFVTFFYSLTVHTCMQSF